MVNSWLFDLTSALLSDSGQLLIPLFDIRDGGHHFGPGQLVSRRRKTSMFQKPWSVVAVFG